MTHRPYLDLMQTALDAGKARLMPDQQAELDQHLAECAECRSLWEALAEADRLFKSAPLALPRPGFTGRFKTRLAAQHSRPKTVWGALVLGLGAVGAAALVLPFGVGLLFSFVQAAQQPVATAALLSGFNAAGAYVGAVADALLIAARALGEWVLFSPLVWAASLWALAATMLWLYFVRQLILPEGFR
jgi:predicted anti-sigma-YlaC factor YlaD